MHYRFGFRNTEKETNRSMMRKEFLQIVFVALFFSIVFTPTCAKGSSLPSTDFSPVDLCLVLDRSGSMAYPMGDDTKIGGAKNASLDIVNALLPHDRVSVISFSNEATTEIGLTSDLAAVRDVISQISPKGGTSFGAGLNAALNQFDERSSSSNTRAIIFMSDGKHNTPPDPIPYIEDCKKKNIPIFTVGFASNESDIDVGNLTMMSQGTGGQYVFASDLFQLENAFLRLGHQASNWDKIAEYMGKVSPESTALAGSFNVAAYVGYLRVTLNWPGSDMDLRLFDPSGNEVDIKSPNVTYSGDTKPKYFIIKDPQQGNWTAMVYGKDLNFAEEYYLLASEYKSPIQDTKNSTVTPYSEKISGTGSLKKDYYVLNKANDYAKVSVDIENAAYYEYTYKIYSDEIQCIANLDLVVGHAESITCSGDARNRNNIPANLTTLIKNGNLTYNNSVVASNQGVQASQNITKASGDNIGAIGIAHGENNIMLANIIAANRSECFQSTQKVSIGRDTLTYAFVNAITGPLKVSSYIVGGDRRLNATADVAAGVASIDQLVNLTEALQDFKGVIGGANFDTMIKNANGNKTHVYTSVGSGNLVNLSQRASGKDADYTTEYEYMPTS